MVFGDRKIGESMLIHVGGNDYVAGTKIGITEFKKENGYVIHVSYWTKTK